MQRPHKLFADDIWVSYMTHLIGWKVQRIRLLGDEMMEASGNDSMRAWIASTATWRRVSRQRIDFVDDLRVCGWNV